MAEEEPTEIADKEMMNMFASVWVKVEVEEEDNVQREEEATMEILRETLTRSVTPVRAGQNASQRNSAARRARLMGLALEGHQPVRERPRVLRESLPKNIPAIKGLEVSQTPGGSQVEGANVVRTPGGDVVQRLPVCLDVNNFLEIVETMDLDDEELEEEMEHAPWHVTRWLKDLPEQQSIPDKPRPQPGREACAGSEFDSDFDDLFDRVDMISAALPVQGRIGRDIPHDEELEEPVRDMVEAVGRAMDDEADRLLGVCSSYTWAEDFDSFRGVPETFSGPTPGPIRDYDTPYDAFTDIWSKDIIQHIARETNRYAKQEINKKKVEGTLKPSSRIHEWVDTDEDEVMLLLAVFMYMGIDPRTSQNEYWRSNDYLEMPKFKNIMSFNRYVLLNKFLHFVENRDGQDSLASEETSFSAKLEKLRPVISHLGDKFRTLYNLSRDILIDESLTLYKGCSSWVQTIRSKAARFGMKSCELCESRTGYMYKFQIYTGTGSGTPSERLAAKSTQVVLELLQGLENLGHCVTMDNFYNCPALARYLKSRHFDCLGTLRTNRRNLPEAIAEVPKNVAKGKIIARHCGDVSIIAWKDSKLVTMISTYHNSETYVRKKAGNVLVRPVCVRDYAKAIGGVALQDQKLSMYLSERKRCVKWYMKMFKRLLNVSIQNAFVMYASTLRRRGKLPTTHREFRYELAKSLVDRHRARQPQIREQLGEITRLRRDVVHGPKYESGSTNRKRCVVCLRQGHRKMVHTQCVTCSVFLCFGDCWSEWHSLPVLKGQERGRKRRRASED